MYKLTQFADDTTIILDGTSKSLQATLNILEIFCEISGLKMNSEKTKLIWIGSKTGTNEKSVSQKLHWGELRFDLLGITFSCNLNEMPDLNYSQALGRAKQTLNSWKFRCLTPIGKITVIKSLILSKFTHLFGTLPAFGVQEWLFKTKVADNSDCRLCNEHTESIADISTLPDNQNSLLKQKYFLHKNRVPTDALTTEIRFQI